MDETKNEIKKKKINYIIKIEDKSLNGKGKEYYKDGTLKFEGEYLNGKRNGKGKKYYFDGLPEIEGYYLN